MEDHFASIDGIPLLAVFDRPKTIAQTSAAGGQVIQWNPTFAGVTVDLGLGIDAAGAAAVSRRSWLRPSPRRS